MTAPRKRGRPVGTTKPAEERKRALGTSVTAEQRAALDELRARGYTVGNVLDAGIQAVRERLALRLAPPLD